MKKFSKETNTKVNKEPEIKNERSSSDELYYSILELANDFLKPLFMGSVTPWGIAAASPVKIDGKELFAQALLEYLKNKEVLKKLQELYDEKVENSKINENLKPYANNISKFLDIYNDDKFDAMLSEYSSRMKDGKVSYFRHVVAEKMLSNPEYSKYPKDKLKKISECYLNKSKELGFETNEIS